LNWPGLFAWSTKYHDGTAPSQFKQMTDEDREFLQRAMEEAFGKIEDPNVIFQEAIKQVGAPDRTPESVSTALEIMDRCADDPDVARNVEKLGGLVAMHELCQAFDGPIRARTLEILALLFSNNPSIQACGVKHGFMKLFIDLTKGAPVASEERSKAFRALVGLVRSCEAFEEALLRGANGMGLVIEMLSLEEDSKTREKAASFLRSLAGDGRLVAGDLEPLASAVALLLRRAGGEGISYRETLSSCCVALEQAFTGQLPPELTAEVRARMAQAAEEPDAEDEMANLQEYLVPTPQPVAAPPAPPAMLANA